MGASRLTSDEIDREMPVGLRHDAAAALLGYSDADQLLTDVSTSARVIGYSLGGLVASIVASGRRIPSSLRTGTT